MYRRQTLNYRSVTSGLAVHPPHSTEQQEKDENFPNKLVDPFRSSAILMISLSAVVVAYAQSIAGTWQGTLPVGQSSRVVLRIADAGNGALRGSVIFIDRSAHALPLLSTIYRAPNLTAAIFDITFRGKLSADGKSIAGGIPGGGNPGDGQEVH